MWLVGSAKERDIGDAISVRHRGESLRPHHARRRRGVVVVRGSGQSNDSGLMHVAAALDRPMIALYGSVRRLTLLLSDRARGEARGSCSPCFQRVCPLKHFDCMMKLARAAFDEIPSFPT